MRHLRSRTVFGAMMTAMALFSAGVVKADIVPLFSMATPTVGGYTYSYNVFVSAGSKVNTGDYFTIYDFNGYIVGSAFAPVDWSITAQNVGITPAGQLISEDAGTVNLTFTYTGLASLPAGGPVGGPDAFGADSTFGNPNTAGGKYASETHKDNPGQADDNTLQSNQGFVVTPAVPEASSLALLVPGLLSLGLLARRRTRKQ